MENYVHGYSLKESERLQDQANTLSDFLHYDSIYPEYSSILESGCGTGSQTIYLAQNNPTCKITSVDLSSESLQKAEQKIIELGLTNVNFVQGNLFNLPFTNESFDHIFICFVLEHLQRPKKALYLLKNVLKCGGSITIIEGDHNTSLVHPKSEYAEQVIQCLIDVQSKLGGNSLIGREIYPLLVEMGFNNAKVSPRMIYVDGSKPNLIDGFTIKTFTAMVEGVREQALMMDLVNEETWNKGIKDLYRSAQPDGTFCYTFFKGKGFKK